MNIGIDGNEANVDKHVGVSTYTLELLKQFAALNDKTLYFTIFLKEKPKNCMPKENANFIYKVIPGKFLWSQIFLPFYLFKNRKIDVFFSPAHYSPRFLSQPLVVTIHDLSYKNFPNDFLKKDLYKLTHWSDYSIKKANEIIAVSKTTKRDILREYGVAHDKVHVIHNGFTYESNPAKSTVSIDKKYNLKTNKYILHVGTLQPRKNIPFLIQAFKLFANRHPEFKLILVGKEGWLYKDIINLIKNEQLEEKVVLTGYVDDKLKNLLYKNAFCLVMPSLYEGFGIPILEAMYHSCPVVASYSSSLPEVGGDACIYFDPKDKDDLLEKMEILVNDTNLYKTLKSKGKKRIKAFSWDICAKSTLSVILKATR